MGAILLARCNFGVGFWQNGFFADFSFWAAGFFRGFLLLRIRQQKVSEGGVGTGERARELPFRADNWTVALPEWEETLPLDFSLSQPHHRGSHPWRFSLAQWNRFQWFFSRVRILLQNSRCCARCSVLELYVAYVFENGGDRFESQISDGEKGGWLLTQVERFREAVLSWQLRAAPEPIFSNKQNASEQTDWHSRFGLPKFQLAMLRIVPPRWASVRGWISSIQTRLAGRQICGTNAWRQAELGRESSQLMIEDHDGTLATTSRTVPRCRICAKMQLPLWHQQCLIAQKRQEVLCEQLTTKYGILLCIEYLFSRYVLPDRGTVVHHLRQQRCNLRRIRLMLSHNEGATRARQHLCPSALLERRSFCLACRSSGFFDGHMSWVAQSCPSTQKDCQTALNAAQAALMQQQELAQHLVELLQKLVCMA